jgi:poly(ADP-ribose) glycohydrolase ARH3
MAQRPVHPHPPHASDRFRGTLLGTAVGDALGAPFEGHPQVDPARLEAWAHDQAPLRWTDDTHMTIGVAESLLQHRGLDQAHMAQHLATRWRAEPWRGYGAGPPQVFTAMATGVPWQEAAGALFGGQGSHGNGAAMRVAPTALLVAPDLERTQALARATARLTHTHELGQQGAALQACAVAWLLDADSASAHTDPIAFATALLAAVRPTAPAPQYQQRLDALAHGVGHWSTHEAVAALGRGVQAIESIPAALFALLRHPSSFPDAVRLAVRLGGDTDTIAAMTGALSGALLGASAIPTAWQARLEQADRLAGLADGLLRAVQPPT